MTTAWSSSTASTGRRSPPAANSANGVSREGLAHPVRIAMLHYHYQLSRTRHSHDPRRIAFGKGGSQMPRGASPKRERQYEHIKESARKSGRYGSRAEEVAARTVNKIRTEKGETRSQRSTSKRSPRRSSAKRSRSRSTASKSRPAKLRARGSSTRKP